MTDTNLGYIETSKLSSSKWSIDDQRRVNRCYLLGGYCVLAVIYIFISLGINIFTYEPHGNDMDILYLLCISISLAFFLCGHLTFSIAFILKWRNKEDVWLSFAGQISLVSGVLAYGFDLLARAILSCNKSLITTNSMSRVLCDSLTFASVLNAVSPILLLEFFLDNNRQVSHAVWGLSFAFTLISTYLTEDYPNLLSIPTMVAIAAMTHEKRHEHDKMIPLIESLRMTSAHKSAKWLSLTSAISCLSHDLYSPIQAMELGFGTLTEILSGSFKGVDKQSAEIISPFVEDMSGTLQTLNCIIDLYMDASKLSIKQELVPHISSFDILETINGIWMRLANMDRACPVELDFEYSGDIKTHLVRSDCRWFESSVLCILSNALKFSDNDDIPVRLKVRCEFSSVSPSVIVEARDSCSGITDTMRAKFFSTPNLSSTTRGRLGGAGLGLYVLSERMKALGGSFGAKARSDGLCEGSVVWFSLPFRLVQTAADEIHQMRSQRAPPCERVTSVSKVMGSELTGDREAALPASSAILPIQSPSPQSVKSGVSSEVSSQLLSPSLSRSLEVSEMASSKAAPLKIISSKGRGSLTSINTGSSKVISGGKSLSVLVVDDSIAITKVTSMSLAKAGHEVETAHNGKEALGKMTNKQYDVVLMDIQMPVMGGPAATRSLRALEPALAQEESGRKARQVIIGMSANCNQEIRSEALSAGMDGFVAKPFQLTDILTILQEAGVSATIADTASAPILQENSIEPVVKTTAAKSGLSIVREKEEDVRREDSTAPRDSTGCDSTVGVDINVSDAVALSPTLELHCIGSGRPPIL